MGYKSFLVTRTSERSISFPKINNQHLHFESYVLFSDFDEKPAI